MTLSRAVFSAKECKFHLPSSWSLSHSHGPLMGPVVRDGDEPRVRGGGGHKYEGEGRKYEEGRVKYCGWWTDSGKETMIWKGQDCGWTEEGTTETKTARTNEQMKEWRNERGPSIKYVTLFLMIFDPPPSPLSQTVTNLGPPLKVCHTSEQKVNKQISGKCRLPLNNFNRYCILNKNKRTYWVFQINPELPMKI